MSKKKDNEKKELYKTISYILMFFFFILGFTLGILYKVFFPSEENFAYKQTREGGYEFINPLIDFETTDSAKIGELVKLEKDLQSYIDEKIGNYRISNISHISIYYKDLNSGAWIGINEDETFSPASLLKLPIMIATYKLAESQKDLLEKSIVFTREETGATQNFLPENHLEEGKTYTLDRLVEQLIIYSDNDALYPIEQLTTYENLAKIYTDLGLRNPYEPENENTMTVKDYASFFRILYNASYLNKEMSEKALKVLSQTEYDDGLSAGIPENVKISNKFGEREYKDALIYERKQLHDCGIIYHPTKPYLLCVMTKGSNFESLQEILKEISSSIYTKVDRK
ncbi:hypothetical protein CVU76_01755 [Candidatus Dojkabacteria bacterium HGW-Dojkabacteria-1]|uniref:Beta-lactamase class A catalytic domain-containing protein n=1 Tax=Candidatus Dojkabacteria bacterium HGW-Dojkabacteria-1 TaxID=2013761 RepID=A0A2N2F3F0_9BACT|nr:MAG: hypothetical protein CVU76_01755 [Candidatus Dojkabacteria bacterium HGW-Dojkabacteria-1]